MARVTAVPCVALMAALVFRSNAEVFGAVEDPTAPPPATPIVVPVIRGPAPRVKVAVTVGPLPFPPPLPPPPPAALLSGTDAVAQQKSMSKSAYWSQ